MATLNRHVFVALATAALIAGCTHTASDDASPKGGERPAVSDADQSAQEGRAGDQGGGDEVAEEQELTQKRLEAFAAARENGKVGAGLTVTNYPAPGWNGEQLLNANTDDWEPALAADPNAPYVYLLTTRYGAPKLCPKHCPAPYLALTISSDGGRTWGPQHPLCMCRGAKAQYDPTIEVVPDTGDVYATFLNGDRAGGFSAAFFRSQDHGRTWTRPVHVYGNVAWTDKPEVTSSADGRDVYVSWNGPQGGDLYAGVSHDFGRTWSQYKLSSSKRYYYAYDATTLPNGTVVFSESSLLYGSGGREVKGKTWHHAVISRDRGKTWRNVVLDKVENGQPCVARGCSSDFYIGQTSVASDAAGRLAFSYEGSRSAGGPQRIFVRTSTDQGRIWSGRVALSAPDEIATGPRIDFAGPRKARIWYMQTSGGDPDAWNVWFRSSSDGGTTWGRPVKLSDATSGPGYVGAHGFKEIYGDYGEIAVTNTGKTIAAWGEGFSYIGPGGTWFALQK
ncbi:MAG: sialidase family protein [Sporichthyaceae bacterium]